MKIVVDTNIVFSAILNVDSTIARILLNSQTGVKFYSCSYLKKEITNHHTKLLKLTRLKLHELIELENLVTKNITFIDERLIPLKLLLQSEALLSDIDIKDTAFVALAKFLKGKLWTGDKKLYTALKLKRNKNLLTTPELLMLLD